MQDTSCNCRGGQLWMGWPTSVTASRFSGYQVCQLSKTQLYRATTGLDSSVHTESWVSKQHGCKTANTQIRYWHRVYCWNSKPHRCQQCSCVGTDSRYQSQRCIPPVLFHQQFPLASMLPRSHQLSDMPIITRKNAIQLNSWHFCIMILTHDGTQQHQHKTWQLMLHCQFRLPTMLHIFNFKLLPPFSTYHLCISSILIYKFLPTPTQSSVDQNVSDFGKTYKTCATSLF